MDAYSLQRMKLLLCMRDCIAHAHNDEIPQELQNLRAQRTNLINQILGLRQIQPFTGENLQMLTNISGTLSRIRERISELEKIPWNAMENPHLRGRIEALFLCHLVTAPMLEVDDVGTAQFARNMRNYFGWNGSIGINGEIPVNDRFDCTRIGRHTPSSISDDSRSTNICSR
uniref:Uncharacterized protein n=1 Tax=Chenopodium quinoa TaxID=63459 RepID=A0A803LCP5_CHEQI